MGTNDVTTYAVLGRAMPYEHKDVAVQIIYGEPSSGQETFRSHPHCEKFTTKNFLQKEKEKKKSRGKVHKTRKRMHTF